MIIPQKKNLKFLIFKVKILIFFVWFFYSTPHFWSDTSASVIVTVTAADAFATTMDTIHLHLSPAEASIFNRTQLHDNKRTHNYCH